MEKTLEQSATTPDCDSASSVEWNRLKLAAAAARTARRVGRLRIEALGMTLVAIALMVMAGICFHSAFGHTGDQFAANLHNTGWCLLLASWFYLVAQVIHIRANTER